jgi:GntR family transcriptional regulator
VFTVLTVIVNRGLESPQQLPADNHRKGSILKIIISNRSGVPIYEQIKEQIKAAIFSGELREDEQLPSVRVLARDLKISVVTTTRAYTDLEQEGFVVNMQGKGCFVLPRNTELARENTMHKIEGGLATAITAARAEGISKQEVFECINLLWEIEDE